MMTTIAGIFLGIIQGLTEFLPVSSSGHLVLFQNLLGFKEPEILFDCFLHLGTLVAVLLFFSSDLKRMTRETWAFIRKPGLDRGEIGHAHENPYASLFFWVCIGSIPTALIGLAFRSPLEALFGSVTTTGFMLLFTGLILAVIRLLPKGYNRRKRVGLLTALAVGFAQGLAIIPGISRSGATIVCGMACKMERELAARYSFLLSIPAILGALVLQMSSGDWGTVTVLPLLSGFLASSIMGLIALRILMGMVRKGSLFYFSPYCLVLGLIILFIT